MTKGFYQHYSPEDHVFIDRVLELVARVEQQYSFELTSFLNPHQVNILRQIGAHHGLQVFSSAEIYPTEYARVILAPSYYQLEASDLLNTIRRAGLAVPPVKSGKIADRPFSHHNDRQETQSMLIR